MLKMKSDQKKPLVCHLKPNQMILMTMMMLMMITLNLRLLLKRWTKTKWSIDYEQMVKIVQKSNWHEVNIENASSSFTRNLKRNETNLLSSIWKRLCEDFYTRNFICCVSICVRKMETLSLLFLQWSPLYNTTQCNPTNIWLLLINIERQLFFKFIQLTYTYI